MSVPRTTRVLLVDDSATVRAVVRRLLGRDAGVQVVGEAADGEAAVARTLELEPDLILMDLEMPGIDGYAAIERIMAARPTPILVLTARARGGEMRPVFEAIRRGAIEVLPKPDDPAGWELLAATLPPAVQAVARARVAAGDAGSPRAAARHGDAAVAAAPPFVATAAAARLVWPAPARPLRWLAVGASTGGPTAVRALLAALPHDVPASVLVVQHIAAGFEGSFAAWLASDLGRDVALAADRERPRAGAIRVARGGAHLLLEGSGVLRLDDRTPARHGHRPSADELFRSCAEASPLETAGVLLTGMGSDGAAGLAELRRRGGVTAVQDEASSVVFGMPRAALEAGAAEAALPPSEIGSALARHFAGGLR